MLQYEDLTLDDVNYYWAGSVLLRESKGELIPCTIREIDYDSEFPIKLNDMRTGEKHIGLRLETFVRTVLIHHPCLGYGDFMGVPIYLSPRASQAKRKGIDVNNIVARCPVDWTSSVKELLSALNDQAKKLIEGGRQTLPKELTTSWQRLRNTLAHIQGSRLPRHGVARGMFDPPRTRVGDGAIRIKKDPVWAQLMCQAVNNSYPSLGEAVRLLNEDSRVGVSISRDFALVKSASNQPRYVHLYHRMSQVGEFNTTTGEIVFNEKLSSPATEAVRLSFNRLRR